MLSVRHDLQMAGLDLYTYRRTILLYQGRNTQVFHLAFVDQQMGVRMNLRSQPLGMTIYRKNLNLVKSIYENKVVSGRPSSPSSALQMETGYGSEPDQESIKSVQHTHTDTHTHTHTHTHTAYGIDNLLLIFCAVS